MWWDRNFMISEIALSLVPSVLLIIIYLFSHSIQDEINNWLANGQSTFLFTLSTISATMLGFIITGVSIIVAFFNGSNERLELLRKNEQYGRLFEIYFSTIRYLAFATGFFIIGPFIPKNLSFLYLIIMFWIIMIIIFRIGRSVWVLKKLVNISRNA